MSDCNLKPGKLNSIHQAPTVITKAEKRFHETSILSTNIKMFLDKFKHVEFKDLTWLILKYYNKRNSNIFPNKTSVWHCVKKKLHHRQAK